jgi:hypothetical protein
VLGSNEIALKPESAHVMKHFPQLMHMTCGFEISLGLCRESETHVVDERHDLLLVVQLLVRSNARQSAPKSSCTLAAGRIPPLAGASKALSCSASHKNQSRSRLVTNLTIDRIIQRAFLLVQLHNFLV